jgi:hypothetical protein
VLPLALLAAGCASPRQPLTLGVAADDVRTVEAFAGDVGVPIGAYEWYQAWGSAAPFDRAGAGAAAAEGVLPVLTWEPWDLAAGVQQPTYSLARIADGSHDGYVTGFARQVRD